MIASMPEEAELAAKKAELERLSLILSGKELDLEDLKPAIARFQHRYFSELGRKYVELDELRAQAAEHRARRSPRDSVLNHEAKKVREQANQTAGEYRAASDETSCSALKPKASEDIKNLYRRIAAIIHPDKATDERSRDIRTRLMADLNEAYEHGDLLRMQAILAEWQASPEAVSGEGIASELVRAIRAIAQVQRRIDEIDKDILDLMASDIHALMVRVHEADSSGRDIFAEMAEALDGEIADARRELLTG